VRNAVRRVSTTFLRVALALGLGAGVAFLHSQGMMVSVKYVDSAGESSDPVELVTKSALDMYVSKTDFDVTINAMTAQLEGMRAGMIEMNDRVKSVSAESLTVSD
jgi:hypothetical protein